MTAAQARKENARQANAPLIGFCRCPQPASQRRMFGPAVLRSNLLISESDLDNLKVRCISCGSTYCMVAPKLVA